MVCDIFDYFMYSSYFAMWHYWGAVLQNFQQYKYQDILNSTRVKNILMAPTTVLGIVHIMHKGVF